MSGYLYWWLPPPLLPTFIGNSYVTIRSKKTYKLPTLLLQYLHRLHFHSGIYDIEVNRIFLISNRIWGFIEWSDIQFLCRTLPPPLAPSDWLTWLCSLFDLFRSSWICLQLIYNMTHIQSNWNLTLLHTLDRSRLHLTYPPGQRFWIILVRFFFVWIFVKTS